MNKGLGTKTIYLGKTAKKDSDILNYLRDQQTERKQSFNNQQNQRNGQKNYANYNRNSDATNAINAINATRQRGVFEPNESFSSNGLNTTRTWQPKDGYIPQGPTKQDQISTDVKAIKERLDGYIKILPENYAACQPGLYIRYLKKEPDGKWKYRSGGILEKNRYPDYWVLKSIGGGRREVKWSVPLKSQNQYFKKDMEAQKQLQIKKDRLYEAAQQGKVIIMSPIEYQEIQNKLNSLAHNRGN